MKSMKTTAALMALAGTLALAGPVLADEYEVTITNITRGQTFTPILVAGHESGVRIFDLGAEASPALSLLAEDGDVVPLTILLEDMDEVSDVQNSGGLLDAGKSVSVIITAQGNADHLSLAAMLIPTNDAFVALADVPLPKGTATSVFRAPAYDAGSEPNDEDCDNIPGPVCGGEGASPEVGGEGFVHIHAGIHGIGGRRDLVEEDRDWRNPVARVTIRRLSE